jgi:hypothetical protein
VPWKRFPSLKLLPRQVGSWESFFHFLSFLAQVFSAIINEICWERVQWCFCIPPVSFLFRLASNSDHRNFSPFDLFNCAYCCEISLNSFENNVVNRRNG